MPPVDNRAVIVGASLEGLLLGAELARAGWSVDLFERRFAAGGRFSGAPHRGFHLERGIHFAPYGSRGALGELLFRQGEPVELRELGNSHVVDDGQVELLPLGLSSLSKSPSLGLLDRLRALRLALRLRSSADPGANVDEDLDAWLGSIGATPPFGDAIRRMASAFVMCAAEGRLSTRELLETLRRGLDRGVIASYPGEGWGRVIDRARDRFMSHGGRCHFGLGVESICGTGTQIEGLIDERGVRHAAETVIWTADARGLSRAVPFPVVALTESVACLAPVAGISVSWGLSEPVTATTGFWSIDDPRAWVFFPSNVAPSVAPPGQQCVQAMLPWSGPVPDRRARRRVADGLERRLDEVFPGFSDRVIFRRSTFLPRAQAVDGRVGAGRSDRPPTNLQTPRGLYFVGRECAGPGLGPDVAFESVRRCIVDLLGMDAVLPTETAPQSSEAGSALQPRVRKEDA